MAESIIAVSQGSGKNVHTWNRTIGGSSVEDEYMQLGESGLLSYSITTPSTSAATALSHTLQIMAGGTNRVRVRYIEIWQSAAATTGGLYTFSILKLSTAGTGGTAITPMALDPGDAAAGCTAMTLPTVKGTEVGANVMATAVPYFIQTIGASTVMNNPIVRWDFDRPRSKPLIIPNGTTNGIAIKSVSGVAGASVVVYVIVDETSFL